MVESDRRWRRDASRLLLDHSPWLRVFADDVVLPNGQQIDGFLRVEGREHVQVFAVTEAREVVFVREYKYGPDRTAVKLPAGYLEDGEALEACARRELLEETGFAADQWEYLGGYTVDGNRGFGVGHFFLAVGAHVAQPAQPDEYEEMTVELVPLAEVPRLLTSGQFAEIGPVAGVGLALARLQQSGSP